MYINDGRQLSKQIRNENKTNGTPFRIVYRTLSKQRTEAEHKSSNLYYVPRTRTYNMRQCLSFISKRDPVDYHDGLPPLAIMSIPSSSDSIVFGRRITVLKSLNIVANTVYATVLIEPEKEQKGITIGKIYTS